MEQLTDLLYKMMMWGISLWKMVTWAIIQLFPDRIRRTTKRIYAKADIMIHEEYQDGHIDDNEEDEDSNNAGEGAEDSNKNKSTRQTKKPWDVTLYNRKFYTRLAQDGSLGMGESYMEKWWDCEALDQLFYRFLTCGLYAKSLKPLDKFLLHLQFDVFNLQTAAKSVEVGEKHYDLGNEFFAKMLDSSMNYSCGYWRNAKNLEEAQRHKMQLIGRKLDLKPGMRILELGCGFGHLAKFLAETYKVSVVACTISKEQGKYGQQLCKGLPVDIHVIDYRVLAESLTEKFDRVVSVGIMEHIGHSNYNTFFNIATKSLVDHGLFLVHTIGLDNHHVPPIEPWFNTYIFPGGILPYHTQIAETAMANSFTIEDWHNFGSDYDKTLLAWHANFVKNWPTIKHLCKKDAENFYRMWTYYLLISAACFRSRRYQLWQVIMSKGGVPGGYLSVR